MPPLSEPLHAGVVDLRALVESLPVVVYLDDAQANTPLYVSPQIEALTGHQVAEFAAQPGLWFQLVHPLDRDRVEAVTSALRGSEDRWSLDYRIVTAAGDERWVHDEGHVVHGEGPGERLWQGVWIDITTRRLAAEETERKLRDAERRYRALVEQIPAVLYVDIAGAFTSSYVSPQSEAVLGIAPEVWISQADWWESHLHPEDRDGAIAWYRSSLSGGSPGQEYRMVRPDGSIVWIRDQYAVLPDDDGEPSLVQGVMFDITELKAVEAELLGSLEREQDNATHLRALDAMKNTLLHAVSHDLRSPLTGVAGAASLLQRDGLSEQERAELVKVIEASAAKMTRLTTDLLDLDRVGRGIIEPVRRAVDVEMLIRSVVEDLTHDWEASAEMGEVIIRVEPPGLEAQLDLSRVERIVENLVRNAIRHTPAGTAVWVGAQPREQGVELAVEDAGPGVPEAIRASIFEPFLRGDDPARDGSGIGLSLVARFAELHGGRAWVQDRDGGGASFRVYLPER